MKYKFKKLEIGSVIEMTDRVGRVAKGTVQQLYPHDPSGHIVVKFMKTVVLYPNCTDEEFTFDEGQNTLFDKNGLYHDDDPESLRITKIKKPWSMLPDELKAGMKVCIAYKGKWVKGVVERVERFAEIQFEEVLELWDDIVSSKVEYHIDGTIAVPISAQGFNKAAFRIARYKK